MATFINGKNYSFQVDVDQLLETPTGTPDFQNLCFTNIDITDNANTNTFTRSCEGDFANNQTTFVDWQFDVTAIADKDDTTMLAVQGARLYLDRRNRNVVKITDDYDGSVVEFNAPITAYGDVRNIGDQVEFSFTFKMNGTPTIT